MSFPMMTSPVMPCSVAVFTIGLLLAFSKRVNIFLVMFLCHWALIGFTKTYFFHIPEDFLLASSAVPGLYLFFKEYTASHLHTSTLFRARMINLALIIACGAIGVHVHDIYGVRTGSRTGFIEIKHVLMRYFAKSFVLFANKLS